LQQTGFKISTLIHDLYNLFSLEAQDKKIRLVLPVIDQQHEPSYLGDVIRIGQVLINLVGNAVKFTTEGQVSVTWQEETLDAERIRLTFTVSDTGPGISKADQEAIFESFSQGRDTPPDVGTGLGLSISRRLAEILDGHLRVESERGKGSQFEFSAVVHYLGAQVNDVVASPEPEGEKQAPEVTAPSPGMSILLVEDNKINQELALNMLEKAGHQVTLADNGTIALECLEQQSFDLVLMDIRMPVMDGLEAIRHIRANELTRRQVVIALSAGALDDEVSEAIAAGFDHYLTKPVDFNALDTLLADIRGTTATHELPVTSGPVEFRGIRFDRAINNHDGDVPFVVTLTSDFISYYADADTEVKALLERQDQEGAERLMHNIAGIAGAFGADRLMASARTIEQVLRNDGEPTSDQFETLTKEHSNFLTAIEEFQQSQRDGMQESVR
jgi:CheY-like chemotaxis protein/anti-sigma regulatory factor (Ser/Thr protein kinase)